MLNQQKHFNAFINSDVEQCFSLDAQSKRLKQQICFNALIDSHYNVFLDMAISTMIISTLLWTGMPLWF